MSSITLQCFHIAEPEVTLEHCPVKQKSTVVMAVVRNVTDFVSESDRFCLFFHKSKIRQWEFHFALIQCLFYMD